MPSQLACSESKVHKEILQLLSQHPSGLKVSDFTAAYRKKYCKDLVLSRHGFNKLTGLFNAMKDFVDILELNGDQFVKIKSKHIHEDQASGSCHYEGPRHSREDSPVTALSCQHSSLLSKVHEEILQLLSQHPSGLKVSDFTAAYRRKYCEDLVLSRHGFNKLTGLFKAMKDYVDILELNGDQFVKIKSKHILLQDQVSVSCHYEGPRHSREDSPVTPLSCQHGTLLMSEENHNSATRKSFRHDQDQSQQRSGSPVPVQTDPMKELKASLQALMKKHPQGVPLTAVRRSCPTLYHPALLNNYASVKHLLASLTDVVQLQGIGVQTLVHPAAVRTKSH